MNIFWLDYDFEKSVSYYCDQYVAKRFYNTHNSYFVIERLETPNLPNKWFTEPPQCMPFIYKSVDYVLAYRNYYGIYYEGEVNYDSLCEIVTSLN